MKFDRRHGNNSTETAARCQNYMKIPTTNQWLWDSAIFYVKTPVCLVNKRPTKDFYFPGEGFLGLRDTVYPYSNVTRENTGVR